MLHRILLSCDFYFLLLFGFFVWFGFLGAVGFFVWFFSLTSWIFWFCFVEQLFAISTRCHGLGSLSGSP